MHGSFDELMEMRQQTRQDHIRYNTMLTPAQRIKAWNMMVNRVSDNPDSPMGRRYYAWLQTSQTLRPMNDDIPRILTDIEMPELEDSSTTLTYHVVTDPDDKMNDIFIRPAMALIGNGSSFDVINYEGDLIARIIAYTGNTEGGEYGIIDVIPAQRFRVNVQGGHGKKWEIAHDIPDNVVSPVISVDLRER